MFDEISAESAGVVSARGYENFINREYESTLNAYRERPDNIRENVGQENAIIQGGYSRKQVQELVQNAVDAVREGGSRIYIVATGGALYVANDGKPFDRKGIRTLLHSNMSAKRDEQIGRFGLGFKSVLEITDRPQIFSETVSFGFDAAKSQEVLSTIQPGLDRYPVLRLPFLLDESTEREADPILDKLMGWASTVVRTPFRESVSWLPKKVRDFSPEFLLFSPFVQRLGLEVQGDEDSIASWSSERAGVGEPGVEIVRLMSGDYAADWIVASKDHSPSIEARSEAGDLHSRDVVTVSWAAQRDSRQARERGEIWNHFGTGTQTTLPGIINASFKMNDDRVTLLESKYNAEILDTAIPGLVVRAVPHLSRESDPAAHFNWLPARGREDAPWFRKYLIDPVNRAAAFSPIVPDLRGNLRRLSELNARPISVDDESDVIGRWQDAASVNGVDDWVHESALSSTFRSAIINRFLDLNGRERSNISGWVEGLTGHRTFKTYGSAIIFAADFLGRAVDFNAELRQARIVPMQDGVVGALVGTLHLPLDSDQSDPGLVDVRLLESTEVVDALRKFGARALDNSARLAQHFQYAIASPLKIGLAATFWKAAARSPRAEVIDLILNHDSYGGIPVRTVSGAWLPLECVWAAGDLLDAKNSDDARIVVDPEMPFIGPETYNDLGIPKTLPSQDLLPATQADGEWKQTVQKEATAQAIEDMGKASSLVLEFNRINVTTTPRLHDLDNASTRALARATSLLLSRILKSVKLYATESYSTGGLGVQTHKVSKTVLGPESMWIRDHGVVKTAYGYLPTSAAVAPVEGISDRLLPVPDSHKRLTEIGVLGPLDTSSSAAWKAVFEAASQVLKIQELHELYSHAAAVGAPKPVMLMVGGADRETRREVRRVDCVVAANDATEAHLRKHSRLPLVSSGDFELDIALAEDWGLETTDIEFEETVVYKASVEESEYRRVRDLFPLLRNIDRRAGKFSAFELVPCLKLSTETSNDYDEVIESKEISFEVVDNADERRIFHRATLNRQGILARLLEHAGSKRSASEALEAIMVAEKEQQLENLWDKLKNLNSDEERVIALIGSEGLRELVPEVAIGLLKDEGVLITSSLLFKLAQNLHGTDLWKVIRNEIPEKGTAWEWANSAKVKDLSELGFTEAMLPESLPQKPRTEEVVGPIRLPDLHAYQTATSERIIKVLSASPGHNKGIVQLPTGAGKTRVAVESLAAHIATLPEDQRLIVWIAQSEELCEQAVEAWTSGWQSFGVPGGRLTVSRMWGSRTINEAASGVHVVVSTNHTLARRARDAKDSAAKARYQWLESPSVVVIDEAHGAVASTYTEVLRWFKRSTGQRGKPLLGLSATPYRGTSRDATRDLVKRFDGVLIEPEEYFTAETAHEYLQAIGVLARVNHAELEGTMLRPLHPTKQSDDEERPGIKRQMLENRIDLGSVAGDLNRNHRIVKHVLDHANAIRHAIIFAASVDHAKALAAVLEAKGIPSAAIHGGTPVGVRRSLVQRFKDGDLRVLTNFDVLSQGFDAPKVDTVYLCRPTFSPNKYIQMIGRGLRGPKNGGSDEVLVVNVRDNIEQFGEDLAYTEFEYLWKDPDA